MIAKFFIVVFFVALGISCPYDLLSDIQIDFVARVHLLYAIIFVRSDFGTFELPWKQHTQ